MAGRGQDGPDGGVSGADAQELGFLREFAHEFVSRLDIAGTVVYVSPSVAHVLGRAPAEILGRSLPFADDLDEGRLRASIGRVVAAPGAHELVDVSLRHRDGTSRRMSMDLTSTGFLADSAGVVIVGSWDSSAERALADSERRFRMLVDNAADVVILSDHEGRVAWTSPSVLRVLEWPPAMLVGTDLLDLVHQDERASMQDVLDVLRPAGGAVGEESRRVVVRLRSRLGAHLWMSGTISRTSDDPGSPPELVVVLHDVTDLVQAHERAGAAADRMTAMVTSMIDPFILLEAVRDEAGVLADLRYVEVNEAACAYNRLRREEMIGARLLDLFPGQAMGGPLPEYFEAIETGNSVVFDDYLYPHEILGEARRYDIRAMPAGRDLLAVTWRDVTDRHRAQSETVASEELYRLVTDDVADAVVRFDDTMALTWASPSFERLTGFSRGPVRPGTRLPLAALMDERWVDHLRPRLEQGRRVEGLRLRLRHADDSSSWVSLIAHPFVHADGAADGYVAVLRDIQPEVEAQELVEHQNGHDLLTGLANRHLQLARLSQAMADPANRGLTVALLSIGVDRLSTVNDALGYAAGDAVLRVVSARIVREVGSPDVVARVAADQFAAVVTGLRSEIDSAGLAARLCDAAREPVRYDGHVVVPTVSVGIAGTTKPVEPEELLRRSTLAMRQAKEAGRDRWAFVDSGTADRAARRLHLEEGLRVALAERCIVPWYQPVVDLAGRQVVGYEALARWVRPGSDTVADAGPADFIPVAEHCGLIGPLDRQILTAALARLTSLPGRHMAVNVSMSSLVSPGFREWLLDLLAADPDLTRRVRLEVTETALLRVSDEVLTTMRAAHGLGATWYADDFGTGSPRSATCGTCRSAG